MRFFHEIICGNSPKNNKKELRNFDFATMLINKKKIFVQHTKQKFLCLIISFITSLHIVPIR